MEHWKILVTGEVQGVYFRASARDEAIKFGLKGFVRNEPDGSVYIEAQGEVDGLENFIAWCYEGPPDATIELVEIEKGELMNFTEFIIGH